MTGELRCAGVLMHITALPTRYGIGDLGAVSMALIDFLAEAKVRYWQVLPINTTDSVSDHSPYMTLSTMAGNPLILSPDVLRQRGLLSETDCVPAPPGSLTTDGRVVFDVVEAHKRRILWKAFNKASTDVDVMKKLKEFLRLSENKWVRDYALFMTIREKVHPGKSWIAWPTNLKNRDVASLEKLEEEYADVFCFHCWTQFEFLEQWNQIRLYAKTRDVLLFGDLAIYVSLESSDVWACPKEFDLNPDTLAPRHVSGVPPDYFSATGQLWGHPVYNWAECSRNGFRWWIERFARSFQLFDLIRVDHFRGFESFWQVDAEYARAHGNAIEGAWINAPGRDLFQALIQRMGWKEENGYPICAEDLGVITPEVEQLREALRIPSMRVLQFAFGGHASNVHLPHNIPQNCVVYAGTHDNDTTAGWWKSLDEHSRKHILAYCAHSKDEPSRLLMRLAWGSTAKIAIATVQDILGLDSSARFNTPGTSGKDNWSWCLKSLHGQLTPSLAKELASLAQLYGRETQQSVSVESTKPIV